jgi:hypothetical protein
MADDRKNALQHSVLGSENKQRNLISLYDDTVSIVLYGHGACLPTFMFAASKIGEVWPPPPMACDRCIDKLVQSIIFDSDAGLMGEHCHGWHPNTCVH